MRRDMDLVRAILIAVESNDDPNAFITPRIEGVAELEVCHHIALMSQAGLISARDRSAIGIYFWSAGQLTAEGHEFLECARDDELWNEARRRVEEACGGLPADVLRSVLVDLITARVKAPGPGAAR